MEIIIPISGGKDSQVCLQLAIEKVGAKNVRGLFCDTGFEHPITYQHVENMRRWYGVEIDVVNMGNVPDKVLRYKRFPGGGARFCTDELKIKPTKIYLKETAERLTHGFEVWYGMRTEESVERARRYKNRVSDDVYPPHEFMPGKYPKYLEKLGVMMRLPILHWSKWQVIQELGNKINPLYAHGFDRVGCFPCLASGDVHKERAFRFDEVGAKHKEIVIKLENEIGKSVWTSQGGAQRNNPDQLCLICQI